MVPGSTLRYGSNFCNVTRNPRLSSRHPMEAAAMPFPNDETTPPVTNTYLAIWFRKLHRSLEQLRHTFQILGRIHAQRFVLGLDHPDRVAIFQRAQLLQPLGLFERPHRQVGISQEKVPAVNVQANMFVVRHRQAKACPTIRDDGPREIDRVAGAVRDHLHHVGIALPERSVTTFTTLGSPISRGSSMRFFSVPIWISSSWSSGKMAASIAAGSISGSSPCMFTINSAVSADATSATRSVPEAWSARVIRTGAPKLRAAAAMRSSSVATITLVR